MVKSADGQKSAQKKSFEDDDEVQTLKKCFMPILK